MRASWQRSDREHLGCGGHFAPPLLGGYDTVSQVCIPKTFATAYRNEPTEVEPESVAELGLFSVRRFNGPEPV